MRVVRPWLLVLLSGLAGPARAEEPPPNRIRWQPWETATFEQARREGKPVLLVVSTSWCHWCHVMQRETYADPRVEQTLARGFVAAKEDGDARPDLAERFRKHRWPATAFFAPDGREVLALRGYRSADELLAILADVERRVRSGGPFPGFETAPAPRAPRVDPDRAFLGGLRARLVAQLDATYDRVHQGWGAPQKYPLAEPVLWGLRRAQTHPGEVQPLRRAMDTLAASEALLDPVFGGMFQYSVGPTWNEPHYEKIMGVNAGALEAYARAYEVSGNPRWKRAAEQVKRWFERFLSAPDGAFYTSQDAEVNGREATAYHRLGEADRLALGVPRVDTNVYARENGQAIQAWLAYARAAGDAASEGRALRALERIVASHLDGEQGLFRHDAGGRGGRFYLLDQAEMGLALLERLQSSPALKEVRTVERLAGALEAVFGAPDGGWYDVARPGTPAGAQEARSRSLEGTSQAARFLLRAAAVLDRPGWREQALRGVASLADPAYLADHWRAVGGLLLAVEEALAPMRAVTIHGAVGAPTQASELRAVVTKKRRKDPDLVLRLAPGGEGGLFAVVCDADGACSEPLRTPFALEAALAAPPR
jgi:uncharacterized protein YyaL (SSP411 family)